MPPREFTVVYERRPWSVNEQVRWHWSRRASTVNEWRMAFGLLARQSRIPRLQGITVAARTQTSGRLYDAGNDYYAVKAAVDGLVDAGVIPNDTPRYLHSLTLHAPTHGPDRMVLTIKESL